jgi:multiple sugar transport system ATP-binding protein
VATDTRGVARVVIEHLTKCSQGPKGEIARAVEDACLTVEDKELLVLVGPSGCGKTTTLRLIAGLEESDSGTISIDGQIMNGVPPKERDIAMVFQHYALYPHMSVYENMAFGLRLRKVPRADIEQRVREAAEMLNLEACLNRKPMELSGGQRQRVAVGRAIVRRPRVFLLDEPLSNLDAQLRAQMRAELARLHQRLEVTMIYVTHDQAEAMTLGDRIAVMKEGRIQQVDEPLRVYEQPANRFVAGFFGSPPMNFFDGLVVRRENSLFLQADAGNEPPSLGGFAVRLEEEAAAAAAGCVGKRVVLGIRPEQIAVHCCSDDAPSGQAVKAAVERVEPMGPETHIHLEIDARRFVARVHGADRVKAKEEVWAVFEMRKARLFDWSTGKALVLGVLA